MAFLKEVAATFAAAATVVVFLILAVASRTPVTLATSAAVALAYLVAAVRTEVAIDRNPVALAYRAVVSTVAGKQVTGPSYPVVAAVLLDLADLLVER